MSEVSLMADLSDFSPIIEAFKVYMCSLFSIQECSSGKRRTDQFQGLCRGIQSRAYNQRNLHVSNTQDWRGEKGILMINIIPKKAHPQK